MNWELPEVFERYKTLLNERYEDGDIYFARTLVLLREWPLEALTAAIEKVIAVGVLGDVYILSILRQKDEPECETEQLFIRMELTKYKAPQRPLMDYDNILRLKKEVKSNE